MVAGVGQQRVQPTADQGVSPGVALQRYLAVDRVAGGRTVGVEVGRAVIALDHGDRAAGLQHRAEPSQGFGRARQVLEHEADEDVVERRRRERSIAMGQRVDVGPGKGHVRYPGVVRALPGGGEGLRRQVDGGESRSGAALGDGHGLPAHAAADFKHRAAGREAGVVVQQLRQRAGLVVQPGVLSAAVAVDVPVGHRHRLDHLHQQFGIIDRRLVETVRPHTMSGTSEVRHKRVTGPGRQIRAGQPVGLRAPAAPRWRPAWAAPRGSAVPLPAPRTRRRCRGTSVPMPR